MPKNERPPDNPATKELLIANVAGAYVIRFVDKGLEQELITTARELKTTAEIIITDAVAAYLGRRD